VINFIIVAFCIFLVVKANEQVKKTVAAGGPVSEGVPGLCDDDPDQGDTLSALHE
jgi:large-conductance mechanosensitive channel